MISWLSWGPINANTAVTSSADVELGAPRSRPLRPRSSATRPPTRDGDGDGDGNLSKAHRELQLQLHTTGTYGVHAGRSARLPVDFDRGDYGQAQHRLFNSAERALVWRPWLSGAHGRCAQLLLLIAATICHAWITRNASDGGRRVLASYGPPALAIAVAKSTVFITAQELRRTAMYLPRLSETAGLHRRYIIAQSVVTVLLIAPLLSLPVRPSASFASVYWEALSPDCFTLDRLADHVHGQFPRAVYGPGRDPLLSSPRGSFSSWSASIDPTWQILPADANSNISKSLNLASVGDLNDDWLWGRARAGYALKFPFFAPDLLPQFPVSGEWHQLQRMLVASMACDEVELSSLKYNLSSDITALDVHAINTDGCGASLSLPVRMLSDTQRRELRNLVDRYSAFLAAAANESVFDPYLSAKLELFRPRLTRYAASLDLPSALILPTWLPASAQRDGVPSSSCSRRYILGTPVVPFSEVGGNAEPLEIYAASCVVNYGVSKRIGMHETFPWVSSTKFWNVPFRQCGRPDREVQFSDLDSGSQTYETFPLKQKDRLPSKVFEAFSLELSTSRNFDDWHPLQLLEYEFSVTSPAQRHSHHAIAYATDQLLSRIFQKLTVAAGMLPRECESHVSSKRGSQTFTHLQDGTLQKQTWFCAFYWMSFSLATSLLFFCHVLANDSPSGLPWDVSSIAARATLLCHSSLIRCFEGTSNVPGSLRDLVPIRIGRWLHSYDHAEYSWRADTLLYRGKLKPTKSSFPSWRRHSFSSLPRLANPPIVAGLLALVIAAVVGSHVASRYLVTHVDATMDASPFVPIILGMNWRLTKPFWLQFWGQVVPALISIPLTTAWWDIITYFYKARLPWAELSHPNVASKTLTLDYMISPLPVFKALRNRHWMLATLILGSVLVLPLPFLSANAIDTEWSLEDGEMFTAAKTLVWRRDRLNGSDPNIMRAVLQDSLLALGNASALPKWASYRAALIPYTFDPFTTPIIPLGYAGYWQLETETIRAELQCSSLESEPLFERDSPSRRSQSAFKGLKVRLHEDYSNLDGSNHLVANSCYGQETQGKGQSNMLCSHWELVNLALRGSTAGVPVWVISSTRFVETLKSAHALLCVPRILIGKGNTKLLSMTGSLDDAFVHAHTPTEELLLENEMASEYSNLLNESAFIPNSHMGEWARPRGLRFDSPVVETSGFRGDILSFFSYKEMFRNRLDLDNATLLAEISSLMLSTTFSIAAHTTELLKVPVPVEHVPVVAKVMREIRANSGFVRPAVAYVCMFSLLMLAHIAVMCIYKEYRFPVEPEAVENTWFFLYRSRVIKLMENIKDPQDLSLKSFYARVEALGAKYVFKPAAGSANWTDAKVDVADGFDVRHELDPMGGEHEPLLDRSDSPDLSLREEEVGEGGGEALDEDSPASFERHIEQNSRAEVVSNI